MTLLVAIPVEEEEMRHFRITTMDMTTQILIRIQDRYRHLCIKEDTGMEREISLRMMTLGYHHRVDTTNRTNIPDQDHRPHLTRRCNCLRQEEGQEKIMIDGKEDEMSIERLRIGCSM